MKAAAFLARGLAWGMAGISLIAWSRPTDYGALLLALLWLLSLVGIAILTRTGTEKNGYTWALTWSFMAASFLVIAAVMWRSAP